MCKYIVGGSKTDYDNELMNPYLTKIEISKYIDF